MKRFTTMQDLATGLKVSRADDSTADVVRGLVEPHLTILDDLGFRGRRRSAVH